MEGVGGRGGLRFELMIPPFKKPTLESHAKLSLASPHVRSILIDGAAGRISWEREGSIVAEVGLSLERGEGGADVLRCRYESQRGGEEPRSMDYLLAVSWVACNFGGRGRAVVHCSECSSRVRNLYLGLAATSSAKLVCRRCAGARYSSSNSMNSFQDRQKRVEELLAKRKLGVNEYADLVEDIEGMRAARLHGMGSLIDEANAVADELSASLSPAAWNMVHLDDCRGYEPKTRPRSP